MGFVAMTATTDAELELDMFGMVVDPVGDYHPAAIHIPYGIGNVWSPFLPFIFHMNQCMFFAFYKFVVGHTYMKISYGQWDAGDGHMDAGPYCQRGLLASLEIHATRAALCQERDSLCNVAFWQPPFGHGWQNILPYRFHPF